MKIFKKLLIIVPVVCGLVIFAVMKFNKKAPNRIEGRERVYAVRVIPVPRMEVVPRVKAYGYVKPDKTWQAISEVSGKVVWVHDNLKRGHFIKKGAVLFKIDTTAYGLAEKRGKADLASVDARLKELEQSKKNTERVLAIEKKSLASAGQELKRKRELFRNGYISASDLEKEERTFLSHQTAVNTLINSLDLIPPQKKALEAQKKSGESAVTERTLDIDRTEIQAPFDCRLSAINVELYQFAAAGHVLLEAESIDRAEIPVSLTPKAFLTLMPRDKEVSIPQGLDMETIRRAIDITASVRLPMGKGSPIVWDGTFSRTSESMDLNTGALTIYITVDNPYGQVIPGKRPPLITNMYVAVELKGLPLKERFVIPRNAVRNGQIYLCTPEDRLAIRPVEVEFYMGDVAVLSHGLTEGEILVLADLVPAIEGMRLTPVMAEDTLAILRQQAAGKGELE